jgi:ABC-type sulfate transport system permease component
MLTLQWAGTAAAALIAIGTLLRWTVRRLVRGARWIGAVIELPETVDRLGASVDTLTTSVNQLAHAVEQRSALEPL